MTATSKLVGAALDWAVAQCADLPYPVVYDEQGEAVAVAPSTDWAQAGPIIERQGISVTNTTMSDAYAWAAYLAISEDKVRGEYGSTPLIAAMRCYVASKLGDEIELPEKLQ
jgi:hypothetical protein